MKPIENAYEDAFLYNLAPLAQKGAEELFTTWTLSRMLKHRLDDDPPTAFLKRHEIPPHFWPDMLKAALIAKISYIRPDNPQLDKQARVWLIAVASTLIGLPVDTYTYAEIVQSTRIKYPVLSDWFAKMVAGMKNNEN